MPDPSQDDAPGHPTAGIFLLLFKGAAMAYYIVCGWLPFNFVVNFCVVTFLLVCDFWTDRLWEAWGFLLYKLELYFMSLHVSSNALLFLSFPFLPFLYRFYKLLYNFYRIQVKNVSGRLMVGLRWWNEVSESGGNDWKFESLQEGQRKVNKHDARTFWTVLYGTPVIWVLLGIIAFLKLNVDYLLLIVIAVLLSGANLVGYVKCSKAAQNELQGLRSRLFAEGLRAYFTRGL